MHFDENQNSSSALAKLMISDILNSDFFTRFLCVFLAQRGLLYQHIAELLDVHRNTVRNAVQRYSEGGIDALDNQSRYRPSSPQKPFTEAILSSLRENPPSTSAEAAQRIEAVSGIPISSGRAACFMKQHGMAPRKCGQIPSKANPEQQRTFLKESLEPIIQKAKKGHVKLYFMDAAHFTWGTYLAILWCFQREFIKAPAGRQRHNVLAALDVSSQELVWESNDAYVNSHSVVNLLQKLRAQNKGRRIYLVLDNAPYQRCAYVREFALKLKINLIYLPSYSPNLNLIERLWKFIRKKALNGKYYPTFSEFISALENTLNGIHNGNFEKELKSWITFNFQLFENAQNVAA